MPGGDGAGHPDGRLADRPHHGSAHHQAEPDAGLLRRDRWRITLFGATGLGIPVSTTHTITGAIVGVGAVTRLSAIRWGVAGQIVWAWILTIPCSAFIAALTWSLL